MSLKEGTGLNSLIFNLFEKDNFFVFVYKKSEKIVSALYLVSNLLPDNEPAKWQFREAGVSVLSRILSSTSVPLLKSTMAVSVSLHLVKILSLLDMLFVGGSISKMNYLILKKELENLLEILSFKGDTDGIGGSIQTPEIDKDFFAVAPNAFTFQVNQQEGVRYGEKEEISKSTSINSWEDVSRLGASYKRSFSKGQTDKNGVTDEYRFERKKRIKSTNDKGQKLINDQSVNERRVAILRYLEDKNNLTVKDFFPVIKGCSEKTIQRELLRLVAVGVLKKTGERRWSRYSLASR